MRLNAELGGTLLSRLGKCLEHIDKRAGLCTVKEQAANMSYLEPTLKEENGQIMNWHWSPVINKM